MAEVIWVELLSRGGQVAQRFRCAGPEFRIGRGYRNDVILDDPAVAPEHLRVTQGADGAIIVEGLDPQSTFTIAGAPHDRALIDGDTALRLGHTLLRIRSADYAVPTTVAAVTPRATRSWLAVAALIATALAVDGVSLLLSETAEPRLSRYIGAMTAFGVVLLVWAAIWALFARIFTGTTQFNRQLVIAFGGFLAYTIYSIVAGGLAFVWSSPVVAANAALGLWVALGVVVFLHLRTITPTRPVVKAGIVAVLAAAGIAVQATNQLDQLKNGLQPPIARTTLPPDFRLARPASEDQFFADVTALKAKLDADRAADAP